MANVKIHYIQPFRTDKNIGKAINDAIDQICAYPRDCDGHWIVLTDHDMMWLLPDSKAQVERILMATDYDILGCMTNRLRLPDQLIGGKFIDNDKVRDHIVIAEKCREMWGDQVKTATGVVAAFMMAFRVDLWQRVDGFVENVLNFDTQFCWESQKICEAKIGIMTGVYVFHAYRLMSKNPKNDIKHLIK